MQSAVLAVKGLNESHTAHNLQSELQSICKDWEIDKNKIVAVVSDHAANIVKAVSDEFGPNKSMKCFGHRLNLVIESALEVSFDFTVIIKKI